MTFEVGGKSQIWKTSGVFSTDFHSGRNLEFPGGSGRIGWLCMVTLLGPPRKGAEGFLLIWDCAVAGIIPFTKELQPGGS